MTTPDDPGSTGLPQGAAQDDFTRLRPASAAPRPESATPGPASTTPPASTAAALDVVTAPAAPPSGGSGSWRRWAENEPPAARMMVGDVLRERFVLEEAVGEGGMGLVFRARDRRREEARDRNPFVAIKVLGEEFKRHPDSLVALQREARRMQQLSHPNIAAVYDFDRDGSHVYLVMELLEGESLDKALARTGGPLPFEQARQVIESAGAALHHAHSRNIVHSDFKPANVFLTRDGDVKVFDFGIARFAQSTTPGAESTMTVFDAGELGAFTNAYASPEQMLAVAPPDPRDDVYAFGLVAYEALAGRHPFARKSAVEARFRELKVEPVPGLTAAQNSALAASLSFDRSTRLDNVMELVRAFVPLEERIVATRDGTGAAGGPPVAPAQPRRPAWRTAAIALAGIAWVAFFAIYWSARQDEAGSAPDTGPEAAAVTQPRPEAPPAGGDAAAAPVIAAREPPARAAAPPRTPVVPARVADERLTAGEPATASASGSAETVGTTAATPEPAVAEAAAPSRSPAEEIGTTPAAADAGATPAGSAPEPGAPTELYRWVDREGNVKFGEKPPDEYASSAVKVVGF